MPDSTIVEGIKLVGGILGIATAVFTVWEHIFKHRPQIDIAVVPLKDMIRFGMSERMGVEVHLRIYNASEYVIAITKITHNAEDKITIPFYNSLTGYLSGRSGTSGSAVIRPKAERTFEIAYGDDLPEPFMQKKINVSIDWRPLNARTRRMPLRLSFTIAELDGYREDEWKIRKLESEQKR